MSLVEAFILNNNLTSLKCVKNKDSSSELELLQLFIARPNRSG